MCIRDSLHSRVGQAQSGGQHGLAGAVVLGENEAAFAARGVVVLDLQGERGLSGVHRPAEVEQFGHDRQPLSLIHI